MDPSFWFNAWREGRIAFHQPTVSPELERFGPPWLGAGGLGLGSARVLVPLCGKTLDLGWLAERALEVVGVELVPQAAEGWFTDAGLRPEPVQVGRWPALRHGNLTVVVGDMLEVHPAELGTFSHAWDRGALVAFDAPRRARYAEVIRGLLRPEGSVLLSHFLYDPEKMQGPPHSVPVQEVRALFPDAALELLWEQELIDQQPRFRERGLDSLGLLLHTLEFGARP